METPTTFSFWAVLSACIGGFIVLMGIVMEVLSEKKWFKNVKDFRRCERIKHWGEWLVIIGIAIEVVIAGTAAKDEWETRQIAIKNDPHKQPVQKIRAVVDLHLLSNAPPIIPSQVSLHIGRSSQMLSNLWCFRLESSKTRSMWVLGGRDHSMNEENHVEIEFDARNSDESMVSEWQLSGARPVVGNIDAIDLLAWPMIQREAVLGGM